MPAIVPPFGTVSESTFPLTYVTLSESERLVLVQSEMAPFRCPWQIRGEEEEWMTYGSIDGNITQSAIDGSDAGLTELKFVRKSSIRQWHSGSAGQRRKGS